MRFSNKTRVLIYSSVIILSSYIGFLLGNTFCSVSNEENCLNTILTYIGAINLFNLIGVYVLVNLSEKSITEWNQNSEEEWINFSEISSNSPVKLWTNWTYPFLMLRLSLPYWYKAKSISGSSPNPVTASPGQQSRRGDGTLWRSSHAYSRRRREFPLGSGRRSGGGGESLSTSRRHSCQRARSWTRPASSALRPSEPHCQGASCKWSGCSSAQAFREVHPHQGSPHWSRQPLATLRSSWRLAPRRSLLGSNRWRPGLQKRMRVEFKFRTYLNCRTYTVPWTFELTACLSIASKPLLKLLHFGKIPKKIEISKLTLT